MEWAKSQTGKIPVNLQNISINCLVANVIPLVQGNALNKNIAIENECIEDEIVFADDSLTKTILRNLLTNAIKFTHPNGKVIVSTQKKEDYLEISVTDTGIGINPKNLDKIFRIDSKFTSLGTDKEKGTGLGLILCKEFVELQDGNIRVESELGKGSKFTFTLPLGKK